jgi:hypothetical protein
MIVLLLIASLVVPYSRPFTTQLCNISNEIPLAEQTYYFPIFGFHLFCRFLAQKNHFYLLLLHVFKIKIKNEYKNNNHKRQVSTLKKMPFRGVNPFLQGSLFRASGEPFLF